MLNTIKNPLYSISDLKKSPMTLINKAKEARDAIYIFNNNNPAGVVLDNDTYTVFVEEQSDLKEENTRLASELEVMTTRVRLLTNTTLLTDEEVRGSRAHQELSEVPDEWS